MSAAHNTQIYNLWMVVANPYESGMRLGKVYECGKQCQSLWARFLPCQLSLQLSTTCLKAQKHGPFSSISQHLKHGSAAELEMLEE
jgi:hypothetical protein